MKFDEIQIGKTYYHHNKVVASKGSGTKHDTLHFVYRILKTNNKNKSVFASCNGMPPMSYGCAHYKHWTRERPVDLVMPIKSSKIENEYKPTQK